MKRFLVLYMMPVVGLDAWKEKPIDERKEAEEKMQKEWREWTAAHAKQVRETAGAGSTKRVSKEGIVDAKNSIMLYSVVEAESGEAVAALFKDHPHLGIPESWIEVMPINPLPGMG